MNNNVIVPLINLYNYTLDSHLVPVTYSVSTVYTSRDTDGLYIVTFTSRNEIEGGYVFTPVLSVCIL